MTTPDKIRFDELRNMYNGKELADCFANLHMTFDTEMARVKSRSDIAGTNERVSVLEANAQLVNDSIQEIHGKIIPNLEEKVSDEAKERTRLELWGRKWNLVFGGIEGTLGEKPRDTEKK